MATVTKDFVTRYGVQAGTTVKGTRLISTVATGTAPLTVASNTVVTNLNADLLDGVEGSAYATKAGNLSQFASTSSLELKNLISDETGSGALVFGTSPTITTSLVAGGASFDLLNTTATTINFGGAATTLNIGASAGTVTIAGNLTVNGTTTTINSTTLAVDDKNIIIGDVASPTDTTADGGGITLKGATDKTWNWVNATTSWTSSENIDLASGKVIKIAGTQVLSATQYTGNAATATSATSATSATTATTATNATNTAVTDDTATNATMYPTWVTANTGNLPQKVTSTKLTFNPSTGTLAATAFSGSGASLTSLTAGNLSGTIPSAVLGNSTLYVGTTAVALNRASANLALTGITSIDSTSTNRADDTVTVTANATPTTIDSFAVATYTTAEYLIQAKQGTKMTTTHLTVMWDGTDVSISEWGTMDAAAGAANATYTAAVATGTCTVSASSSDAATTNVVIKAATQYIKA